jgi:integrase/recombinase XerD
MAHNVTYKYYNVTKQMISSHLNWRSEFARLDGAYAALTMRSYHTDVEAFETWCFTEGISTPFPTDSETLCQFLDDQAETKAHSTIKRRLCAIRLVHRLLD